MNLSPKLERLLQKLVGQPCWDVSPGLFPSLTVEMGSPLLHVDELSRPKLRRIFGPHSMWVQGAYHLWTYSSAWNVHSGRRQVGCSARKASIEEAARRIAGRFVEAVTAHNQCRRIAIHFDDGARLELTPREDNYWDLFFPRHMVLTVRGDRMFSYSASNVSPTRQVWRQLCV